MVYVVDYPTHKLDCLVDVIGCQVHPQVPQCTLHEGVHITYHQHTGGYVFRPLLRLLQELSMAILSLFELLEESNNINNINNNNNNKLKKGLIRRVTRYRQEKDREG